LSLKKEIYKNMSNYTKQIKVTEIEVKRNVKLSKEKRITRLTRVENVKYDLLRHYAKENKTTMSKMLDKIIYFYELNYKKC